MKRLWTTVPSGVETANDTREPKNPTEWLAEICISTDSNILLECLFDTLLLCTVQKLLTWADSNVAEFGLFPGPSAWFSSIIGWLADTDTITVATTTGRRTQTPWCPLVPGSVYLIMGKTVTFTLCENSIRTKGSALMLVNAWGFVCVWVPGQTTELLQGLFSLKGPIHIMLFPDVMQLRVRLCQPSPQLTEQELHEDHWSWTPSVTEWFINSVINSGAASLKRCKITWANSGYQLEELLCPLHCLSAGQWWNAEPGYAGAFYLFK